MLQQPFLRIEGSLALRRTHSLVVSVGTEPAGVYSYEHWIGYQSSGGLGLRDSVKVSAETLKAHCAILPASKVMRVRFYGFATQEYVAMAAELMVHFPGVGETLPADVRALAERL